MTQEYVADKLRTIKSAVSRLESGKLRRSLLTTIENYALVVGCEVEITLIPVRTMPLLPRSLANPLRPAYPHFVGMLLDIGKRADILAPFLHNPPPP